MGKRMKRIGVILMAIFIVTVVAGKQAQAADKGDSYVTKAELQDENGQVKTDFKQYDNMQAHYNFTIPANSGLKSGDQMTINLPKQLILNQTVSFKIENPDGEVIGNATADKTTGKLIVTVTKYVETHNQAAITGELSVRVSWNHELVSSGSSVSVDWGVTGETTINVDEGEGLPDQVETLYKWGSVDAKDPTLIHWTVRLNYAQKEIKKAIYKDTIGANQILISGSIDAAHGYYTNNTFNKTSAITKDQIVENGQTGFILTLGDLADTVVMNYDTRATDEGVSTTYANSGELTGEDFTTSTVAVYTPKNGGNGTGNGTEDVTPSKPVVPKPDVPGTDKSVVNKPDTSGADKPILGHTSEKIPQKYVTKKKQQTKVIMKKGNKVKQPVSKKEVKRRTLPKTGEKINFQSMWAGLGLILLSGVLAFVRKQCQ
ncbi:collagen binding domain-containing protein [Dellaglioa sp. L3N]